MEKSGILSLISVNDKESDVLLEYLRKSNNTSIFDFINYLIGKDYIEFLDLLAGSNIKISSHKSLYRDIEYIKVYNYVKEHGFTEESIKSACKIYNKKLSFVKGAVVKIHKSLTGEEINLKFNSERGILDE